MSKYGQLIEHVIIIYPIDFIGSPAFPSRGYKLREKLNILYLFQGMKTLDVDKPW